MREILTTLCENSQNHVYLMSSRTKEELESYCDIEGLGISAETGCFLKFPERKTWETLAHDFDLSWRPKVLEIFQYYAE